MKKIISGILCLVMMLSTNIPTFAAEINMNNSQTTETTVVYGPDSEYTVTIPESIIIPYNKGKGDSTTITVSASNVMINDGNNLNVSISGQTDSKWKLTNIADNNNNIEYIIGTTENGNDIIENSNILTVSAGDYWNSAKSATLYLTVNEDASNTGNYTGIITFTVSITSNNIPTRKPMFSMIHRPSNTTTTVTSDFTITLSDITTYDEDFLNQLIDLGYTYKLYNGEEYYAQIDNRQIISETLMSIEYGEQGQLSIDRNMLGKTFGDLGEYTITIDWPEGNDLLQTKLDFDISSGVPTIKYTWYRADGSISEQDDSIFRSIWILNVDTKTFVLTTPDTIITENMIFYVDGSSILLDIAMSD